MAVPHLGRLSAAVCVAAALCCSVALASYSIDFSASDLTLSPHGRAVDVDLLDCHRLGEVGMPNLPAKGMSVAIPSDMDATEVRIVGVEYVDLPEVYTVAPCEQPVMAGAVSNARATRAAKALAEAVQFPQGVYPGEIIRFISCGWLSGHHLASIMVYPVQYDTVTGSLRLYTHIEFELIMAPGGADAPAIAMPSPVGEEAFASIARSLVINPLEVKPATEQWGALKTMATTVEYLIITDAAYVSNFQPLADWKHAKGYTTEIKTTASIYNNYTGADNSEKIRNCLKDYKTNKGLVYVLLAGDVDKLPSRSKIWFMWDGSEEPPVDFYYSDLTGNWNGDAGGGVVTNTPTSVSFTQGSTYSGSYRDCKDSDNVYHTVVTTTSGSGQAAAFTYTSKTTKNAPTSLTLTFEGQVSAEGTVVLYLWNYTTHVWSVVRVAHLDVATDTALTFPVDTYLDRYVNSGNGEVQCMVRCTLPTATTAQYISIDQLKWEASGDCMYGEPTDNVDMYPDVFVGRASFDTTGEANLIVNKILQYEGAPSKPTLAIDYELKTLLLGGRLDEDGPTDGAVQMDYFADSVIPARFTKTKLYETNNTLTTSAMVANVNAGSNVIAHANHGWWDHIQLAGSHGFGVSDAHDLTNAPRYTGFFGSWACLWGGFDSETQGYPKCLTEQFLLAPRGGGFCAGSSRSGIYFVGDPMNNLSPAVLTEQMKSLFMRNRVRLGEMMAGAIVARLSQCLTDPGTRYCFYINNLLGDPETPVWTNTPATFTVACPATLPIGASTFNVNVTQDGSPVNAAKVCLWKGSEVYAVGITDSDGNRSFSISPLTTGTMYVTVTKINFLPSQRSAEVVAPSVSTTAPLNWINPGWNWISFPLEPIDPSPEAIFGSGVASNRMFRWDASAKNIELYPDDFASIETGRGYLLLADANQNPSYAGYVNPDGFEIAAPMPGWIWIGQPYDKWSEQSGTQVRNNATGAVRTPSEDRAAADPWLNWNWIYWDSERETARICTYNGSGDSSSLGPWRAYRVWANADNLTLLMH